MLADMERVLTKMIIWVCASIFCTIVFAIIKWFILKRRRMALPSPAAHLGKDAPPAMRVRMGPALLAMFLGPLLSVGMYFLCWWLSSLNGHKDKNTFTAAANLGLAVGVGWTVVMALRHVMRVRRSTCINCRKRVRYLAQDTGLVLTCPKCEHQWTAGTVHADVHPAQ